MTESQQLHESLYDMLQNMFVLCALNVGVAVFVGGIVSQRSKTTMTASSNMLTSTTLTHPSMRCRPRPLPKSGKRFATPIKPSQLLTLSRDSRALGNRSPPAVTGGGVYLIIRCRGSHPIVSLHGQASPKRGAPKKKKHEQHKTTG